MIDEVGHGSNQAGEAFILKWLAAWFYGDSYSAHATNKVLAEVRCVGSRSRGETQVLRISCATC